MPVVHRGVEVQARIGRGPGGIADLLPQLAGFQRLHRLAGDARRQLPVGVGLDGGEEGVGERHRVVRVLPRDGEIGLRIPVGVVGVEGDLLVALARELDDALDVVVRHLGAAGELDLALQRRVLLRLEAGVALGLAVDAGLHDALQVLLADLRAGHERRDLLLLAHLPVDVGLDVGVVDVDDDHLGGAPRRAAGLDRAGRPVADLQERHQPGGAPAAGEPLALAAQRREVRAGAGAVLEQARLAHPQIHDAALVDEVVAHALDEAGMRLRVLVGGGRLRELAGPVVDVVVALRRPIDAVGPVQAGVEPLRRVRRAHLARQHVAQLVVEGRGVLLGREIAALPAPIGPAAGKPVEDLLRRMLGDGALALGKLRQRLRVGLGAPQEGGDGVLLDLLQARRDAGLAEVFLGEDVGRDLAPLGRHLDAVQPEDDRAVRVADLADRQPERDLRIRRLARRGVAPLDPHHAPPMPRPDRRRPVFSTPWRAALPARRRRAETRRSERLSPGPLRRRREWEVPPGRPWPPGKRVTEGDARASLAGPSTAVLRPSSKLRIGMPGRLLHYI